MIARDLAEAVRIVEDRRATGARIVFTNGCFDLLHAGHVRYLAEARALGDFLVVGLNSDASVRDLKGPTRPLNSEADRAVVLDALKAVDLVVVFDEATATGPVEALKPEVYAKGGDYRPETLPEAPAVHAGGGRIVLLPFLEGRSTTSLVARMSQPS